MLKPYPSNKPKLTKKFAAKGTPNQKTAEAKPIGTGISSTLLSSQRTTTHRNQEPPRRDPVSGQPIQPTWSTSPLQDLNLAWHRPVFPALAHSTKVGDVVGVALQTGR
jgi:hypothetical protein